MSFNLHNSITEGVVILPILWMNKLRPRGVNNLSKVTQMDMVELRAEARLKKKFLGIMLLTKWSNYQLMGNVMDSLCS